MFTGLVEGLAEIRTVTEEGPGIRLEVVFPKEVTDLSTGASVALNGCCLTVVDRIRVGEHTQASFQAGSETLSKTNLGKLQGGSRVNFERSLSVGDRLGGHFVQGHVDGVGTVESIRQEGDWTFMHFRIPPELARQLVPKGSITVDGVSLTVVDALPQSFSVALIPQTLAVTTLGFRQVGDAVNLETDILGKYVLKLLSERGLA